MAAEAFEALLVSTGLVALAEIGDKTQLLALALTARFRKVWPITAGILVATLLNHALAGALGAWVSAVVPADWLRVALAISFIIMAAWALIPDAEPDADAAPMSGAGVFVATTVAFFLAEMGDKTQVATVALAAKFEALVPVVIGTTVGMLLANVPVVFLGDRLVQRLPLDWIRRTVAVAFLLLGGWVLWPLLSA